MKQDNCRKCGKLFWVEKHHILPKSIFGENRFTVWLCPNCHTDYHQKLGHTNLKNPDSQFHFEFFRQWLVGAICLVLGLGGILAMYWWL